MEPTCSQGKEKQYADTYSQRYFMRGRPDQI